jgi:hypothetical protein
MHICLLSVSVRYIQLRQHTLAQIYLRFEPWHLRTVCAHKYYGRVCLNFQIFYERRFTCAPHTELTVREGSSPPHADITITHTV